MRSVALLACASVLSAGSLGAQSWNSDSALALARRAVLRRVAAGQDSGLRDYKARAHGFLFFMGQFGEGLTEPPRLVTADQLELEVYWKAPRLSKQRIAGWRDRAYLPSDNAYHRDHLGIIQNNFGPLIRLGDGDEVRDVPHPVSPAGLGLYDFRLGDTVTITLPSGPVRVAALHVRPKAFDRPRIVGILHVDVAGADLVRMSFNFTPVSYLDARLEDVSVVLDNALMEGRFWLPYRQEIEIRRRFTWLDLPARGIIRGRWEIDGYVFNLGLVPSWFAGPEIVALPRAERDAFAWAEPLDVAIRDVAEPVRQNDLERVRAEVQRVAGSRMLSGLPSRPLAARGVSDLVHGNRVEGLALGAGVAWRAAGERLRGRTFASYGLSDARVKGVASLSHRAGASVRAYRELRDVSDRPVIAPLVNSISALEFGADYGDYYLAEGAQAELARDLGAREAWRLALARERVRSVEALAAPARGELRPNVALGDRTVSLVRLTLRRRPAGLAARRDASGEVEVETGWVDGADSYTRATAFGQVVRPLGGAGVLLRGFIGWGSEALPPHRAFVLGGRATLLGDPFRRWGGRAAALGHVEWRVPVSGIHLPAGGFGKIPTSVTLAPFAAAGWADDSVAATPWRATGGARVTLGLGVELLGVVRLEAGYGVQSRLVRFSFDVIRDFWDIL